MQFAIDFSNSDHLIMNTSNTSGLSMQVRSPDSLVIAVQLQGVTDASSAARPNASCIVHIYVRVVERCTESIVMLVFAYFWA